MIFSRLWALVQERARLSFAMLMGLVAVGGIVELAGISATAEMMGLVASRGEKLAGRPLGFLLGTFHIGDPSARLRYGLLWAVGVLGFVHGYSILRTYLRAQFVWLQEKEISSKLFAICLNRPYSWFLERNSADLHRAFSAGSLIQSLLDAALSVVGHLAVAGTLTIALFVADVRVALAALIIVCGAYGLVRIFTHKALSEKGGGAHRADRARRTAAHEALTSIRFVKTTGREKFFVEEYSRHVEGASRGMVFHNIYVNTVRSFLEWVTFACLLSLSVYLVTTGDNLEELLPRLTLYTMAGYRLIPAVHEIFGLWSRLRFDSPLLEQVEGLLALPSLGEGPEQVPVEGLTESRNLVTLEGVGFRYDNAERNALEEIDLQVLRGGWLGVVGTTGAGKSTLLDLISGLSPPTQGRIIVGTSVLGEPVTADWQRHLGVVPQEVILLDDSLARNVAFGVPEEQIDLELVNSVCELAGLSRLLGELPQGLQTRMGERGTRLSGGERQRVGLARALYRKPSLLLLDEATSALDQATEARIIETLRSLTSECTMITVAHRLSSVKPCDQIVVIENGRIAAKGDFDTLLSESEDFQRLALSGIPAARS